MVESDAPSTRGSGFVVRLRKAVERIRDRLPSVRRAARRAVIKVLRTVGVFLFWVVAIVLALALVYVFVAENFSNVLGQGLVLPEWPDRVARWLVTHAEPLALLLAIGAFIYEQRRQARDVERNIERTLQEVSLELTSPSESLALLGKMQALLREATSDGWPKPYHEQLEERCKAFFAGSKFRELLREMGRHSIRDPSDRVWRDGLQILGDPVFEPVLGMETSSAFQRAAASVTDKTNGQSKSSVSAETIQFLWDTYSGDIFELLVAVIRSILRSESQPESIVRLLNESQAVRWISRHHQLRWWIEQDEWLTKYITAPRLRPPCHRQPIQMPRKVREWLHKNDFNYHPFAPGLGGDDEELLSKSWHPPIGWEEFTRTLHETTLVQVPTPRDGEILAHSWCLSSLTNRGSTNQNKFVVMLEKEYLPLIDILTETDLFNLLAHSFASTWCRLLGRNPHLFQATPELVQVKIVELLAREFSKLELEIRINDAAHSYSLNHGHLDDVTHGHLDDVTHGHLDDVTHGHLDDVTHRHLDDVHLRWLLWKIQSIFSTSPPGLQDPAIAIQKWLTVKPPGVDLICILVSANSETDAAIIERLLAMTPMLRTQDVVFKIFWPFEFDNLSLPEHVSQVNLVWSKDILKAILDDRFEEATKKDFSVLFSALPNAVEELENRLLDAAAPSLAQLLWAGQMLVDRHLAASSPADKIDIDLLRQVVEELETKGP